MKRMNQGLALRMRRASERIIIIVKSLLQARSCTVKKADTEFLEAEEEGEEEGGGEEEEEHAPLLLIV
jgi:hypothetical protein